MTVAISCGDPSGIGPEIAVKAWDALKDELSVLWIGDPSHLPEKTRWQAVENLGNIEKVCRTALPVLVQDFGSGAIPGRPNPDHASDTIKSIDKAVELTRQGVTSAVCTAPINKKVLADGAGFDYPGHTEYLAHLGGGARVVMMLACDELRVVPATIHIPLADVPNALSAAKLTDTILITHAALRKEFGIAAPRIAVAGLNPHAGEGGRMGIEEQEMIIPVLDALRAEGIDISGPLPADTMFHASARSRYDVAICAYHDQALIPIKTLAFDEGVNITLGLPFTRTSPDHGTAYDIAGKGIASPNSMIAAIRTAARLGVGRKG